MSRLESKEEQELVDWAEDHGWATVKVNIQGNKGWPDRIFMGHDNVTTWIEMKKRGKKPRKLQRYRMYQLALRGHNVGWFDNAQEAIEFLDSTSLPRTRDQDDAIASVRRAILGSWPRQD